MKKYIEIKKLVKELEGEIAWWQESVDEYHDKEEIGVVKGLKRACEVINQQPTTDGWIPCSERLPTKEDYSEDGFVLVQTGGDIIYKGFYDVESGFWADETGFKFAYLPIAWQPLPQPYKESE